jgi:hypothetical protein
MPWGHRTVAYMRTLLDTRATILILLPLTALHTKPPPEMESTT